MAPDIRKYAPFIKSVFGSEESRLDVQMMDLETSFHNPHVQVFFHLLSLAFGRWDAVSVMQLFDYPVFLEKQQLTFEEAGIIRKWEEEAGVKWGFDPDHRNNMLKRDHCLNGMIDNKPSGTWSDCFSRLLLGVAMTAGDNDSALQKLPHIPLESIEISKFELIGKWIRLLRSLKEDLGKLSEEGREPWEKWIRHLIQIARKYVLGGGDKDEEKFLLERLEAFLQKGDRFRDQLFSYQTVHHHLTAFFNECSVNFNETNLQAIRFCSMLPMRAIPSKVIVLLGMEEGAFPKTDNDLSLNLMKGHPRVGYFPGQVDYDRFLFLEILLSARNYLILSYQGMPEGQGKEQLPSLVVSELLDYLDQSVEIEGKKASECCIVKHPLAAYDSVYFSENSPLKCTSTSRYLAAQAFYYPDKTSAHQFIPCFRIGGNRKAEEQPQEISVTLKDLSGFARNPLKTYFNKTLGMYLKGEEDVEIDEKFVLSSLDVHLLRNEGLSTSPDCAIALAQKKGRFPMGLFKTIAEEKIHQETGALKENLASLEVVPEDIFTIECADYCEKPLIHSNQWVLPSPAH